VLVLGLPSNDQTTTIERPNNYRRTIKRASNDQTRSLKSYDACGHSERYARGPLSEGAKAGIQSCRFSGYRRTIKLLPSNDQTRSEKSYDACGHCERYARGPLFEGAKAGSLSCKFSGYRRTIKQVPSNEQTNRDKTRHSLVAALPSNDQTYKSSLN
jgi:hypothetical protein